MSAKDKMNIYEAREILSFIVKRNSVIDSKNPPCLSTRTLEAIEIILANNTMLYETNNAMNDTILELRESLDSRKAELKSEVIKDLCTKMTKVLLEY